MSLGTRWTNSSVAVGYHLSDDQDFGPNNWDLINYNDYATFVADGFGGGAVNFAGTSNYMYRGASVPTADNDWSISIWVKFTTVTANVTYGFLRWVNLSGADYLYTRIILSRDGSNNYTLSVAPSTTSLISYVIPSFATGKWYHIVVTHKTSDEAMVVYLNGAPVATGSGSTGSITTSSIYIGWDAINTKLLGRLDEFVIYYAVLSPGDVRRLYADGKGLLV